MVVGVGVMVTPAVRTECQPVAVERGIGEEWGYWECCNTSVERGLSVLDLSADADTNQIIEP